MPNAIRSGFQRANAVIPTSNTDSAVILISLPAFLNSTVGHGGGNCAGTESAWD